MDFCHQHLSPPAGNEAVHFVRLPCKKTGKVFVLKIMRIFTALFKDTLSPINKECKS
jgi:hypothetical protein